MQPQKKVTHRYMKELDNIFADEDNSLAIGIIYEASQGLFENPFIINTKSYMSDKWSMDLNYSRRSCSLIDLNALVHR